MRTGQVAAEAGVNTETLRYYERRGLLQEPPRRDSGYRAYTAETVATVRFIKEAQKLGFTLSEVEILLHLDRGGPADCEAARALATEKLLDLESRVASLTAMHHSLEQLIATCEQPLGNRECPLIVALGGPADGDCAAFSAPEPVTGHGGAKVETMRIEVLHIPGCPHVDAARQLLLDCLDDLELPRTAVVDRTGPFPSPSIVVDGTDAMGAPEVMSASCRLDVPTRDRVLAALRPLMAGEPSAAR